MGGTAQEKTQREHTRKLSICSAGRIEVLRRPKEGRLELDSAPSSSPTKTRLDVWLWRAQFYTSRTTAARAIRIGEIRMQRVALKRGGTVRVKKPNTPVQIGDELTFVFDDEVLYIQVCSLGQEQDTPTVEGALYTPCGQNLTVNPNANPIALTA